MPTFRQLAKIVVANAAAPLSTEEIARACGDSKRETLDGLHDLQVWGIVVVVRRETGALHWEPRADYASVDDVQALPPWADRKVE